MIDQWIELVQTHGYPVWVGLCVLCLSFGFAFCAGNIRRQILIGYISTIWGVTCFYYTDFYNAPIARYLWFPHWVVIQVSMIIFIFYLKEITDSFCSRFNLKSRKVKPEELRQELIVAVLALLLTFADIAQLGSALSGTGRQTAPYYDDACRILLSTIIIALVLPGKSGLQALKDALSEKIIKLAANRVNSYRNSN